MSTAQVTYQPSGEPEERRKFQLTNLDGNNNKFYLVETWPVGADQVFFRATYGRVGARPQIDERVTHQRWVESKIREKAAKGYQEITLHRPVAPADASTPAVVIEPKVEQLVETVYAEAGKSIASFLAVGVNALSSAQIAQGRTLLLSAQQQYTAWQQSQSRSVFETLTDTVQRFYNAIPTQLPGRIDRQQVVLNFCQAAGEQEDRLNQLEAALATFTTQQGNPRVSLYEALGADLGLLPQNDRRYGEIYDYIDRTCVHGYKVRVRDIFTVAIEAERHAFEQNMIGRSNVELLFHGTGSQNMWHILRSGLICPRVASHGRMFGDGIYFANKCTKSANYCSTSRRGVPHMLFLAHVALGKQHVARSAMPDLKAAPKGCDSVWGKAGKTGSWGSTLQFDEFIVYNTAQQSLRYLVTFER